MFDFGGIDERVTRADEGEEEGEEDGGTERGSQGGPDGIDLKLLRLRSAGMLR